MPLEPDHLWEERLARGHKWEETYAWRLRNAGFRVKVHPHRRTPSKDKIDEYSDFFDLLVSSKAKDLTVKVECKSNRWTYHGPEDLPQEWRGGAIIDRKQTWWRKGYEKDSKEKKTKPVAIVLISNPTGKCAVVPEFTRDIWEIKSVKYADEDGRVYRRAPGYWIGKKHLLDFSYLIFLLNAVFEGSLGDEYFVKEEELK